MKIRYKEMISKRTLMMNVNFDFDFNNNNNTLLIFNFLANKTMRKINFNYMRASRILNSIKFFFNIILIIFVRINKKKK